MTVSAVMGAVLLGLAGSVAMGVALAYEQVAMTWSRAFAVGLLGGAVIGLVLGAVLGSVAVLHAKTGTRARS